MGDTRIGVAAAGGDGAEVLARIQQLEENGVHAALADDRWSGPGMGCDHPWSRRSTHRAHPAWHSDSAHIAPSPDRRGAAWAKRASCAPH